MKNIIKMFNFLVAIKNKISTFVNKIKERIYNVIASTGIIKFIKKYPVLDKVLTTLSYLYRTNIGRLISLFIMLILSTYMYNNTDMLIFLIVRVSSALMLFGYALLFIVYAWIINPLKDYIATKK